MTMSTGKGLTLAENKAYMRGVAAGKREREDALTEIIRSLERQLELSQAEAQGANRTVGELAAELAEVRKDAARYKWLREKPDRLYDDRALGWNSEQMDTAIDAALEETK